MWKEIRNREIQLGGNNSFINRIRSNRSSNLHLSNHKEIISPHHSRSGRDWPTTITTICVCVDKEVISDLWICSCHRRILPRPAVGICFLFFFFFLMIYWGMYTCAYCFVMIGFFFCLILMNLYFYLEVIKCKVIRVLCTIFEVLLNK